MYLLNGNVLIKQYTIASGKISSPSPLGYWKVTSKARWGSGFGTRWMGLNVPWGKCQQEYILITTCQTLEKLRDRLFSIIR
ncbi:L,D-transpeptidase family protein [Alkaliphilus pronyensis]|uniref:L,D-transpeptidase n=1 Tax=Alkaliphilus pronyensis TaxID=1482732 RepID=UPI001FA98BC3|nr:L,D-transpeptidase [Alkaliphilus pronyensis]